MPCDILNDAVNCTSIKDTVIRACTTGRTKYIRRNDETVIFRYKRQEDLNGKTL